MPISSLILNCRPDAVDAVRAAVDQRERSEVREQRKSDLVVVTDTHTLEGDREEMEALSSLPGVISYCVVFTNMEDTLTDEEDGTAAGPFESAEEDQSAGRTSESPSGTRERSADAGGAR